MGTSVKLRVLCVSVVKDQSDGFTTETQSTQSNTEISLKTYLISTGLRKAVEKIST
jgi:hypothetical protein